MKSTLRAGTARPVLARVLERISKGDTLVVVRIDRLARSLSHLLEVIERLEAKGAFFRSIEDPIDTASPQGKFTLQVLGAAAEFERALIRERTKAGLRSARADGRIGGNPGLKARDAGAIRKVRAARVESHFQKLNASAEQWVPEVRRLRPDMPWEDVLRVVNSGLPKESQPWTEARLIRATKTFVKEGLLPEAILGRAVRASKDDRLPAIIAAIKGADPDHLASDLRPSGEHARAHAARSNQVAAFLGQDAASAGTRPGIANAKPMIHANLPRDGRSAWIETVLDGVTTHGDDKTFWGEPQLMDDSAHTDPNSRNGISD